MLYQNEPAEKALACVQQMTGLQAHGGPDGFGYYEDHEQQVIFGHRRLSIIDINGGAQPMRTGNGHLVITFNGEIYNYRELREELRSLGASFETGSDTEVILKAYEIWGTNSFARLQGMFAFALHDRKAQKIFLARDASGIKPLYWANCGKHFAFASETRAMAVVPYCQEENPDWRILLLAFGHIPEPATRLANVKALKKGHYLEFNLQNKQVAVRAFHEFAYQPKQQIDRKEAAREVTSLLASAVKKHLISDVPVGIFLSGGVDSAIISLLAGKSHGEALETLSIIFNETEFSERKYQLQIAEIMKGSHNEYLITSNDLSRHFDEIIEGMDQPTTDGINTWFVSRAAKMRGLKVVLSGLGGDELFGGYPSFKRIALLRRLRRVPSPVLAKTDQFNKTLGRSAYLSTEGPLADYLFLRGYFPPKTIARLLEIPLSRVYEVLQNISLENAQPEYDDLQDGDRAAWLEYNFYMQNQLLRDSDCMSMQHGVELRVPFLDQELVSAVTTMPPDVKFSGEPKSLLTDNFQHLLPTNFTRRPKMGFSFPLQEWMRRIEPMHEMSKSRHVPLSLAMKDFQKNNLHWSKAFALYHVFR
ncbi:MAG: asparagine synthase (glutamine-hydrolyzing) [Mucilaginibacter polytrichastri]|nr:asparagine synthase (glutamine-hydrolyzing) [Mucilaginibacter polytrichastri]